jgi:hypothetical protein
MLAYSIDQTQGETKRVSPLHAEVVTYRRVPASPYSAANGMAVTPSPNGRAIWPGWTT